jgi:hypothetical protein
MIQNKASASSSRCEMGFLTNSNLAAGVHLCFGNTWCQRHLQWASNCAEWELFWRINPEEFTFQNELFSAMEIYKYADRIIRSEQTLL